jgi:ABC-type Mn2+/Zn2+ transport system ATPase subunit
LLSTTEGTTCTSDANGFITKYPNGIIKEVENAFSSGKKALIVAGPNGAGTRALAARVMQGTLAYPS